MILSRLLALSLETHFSFYVGYVRFFGVDCFVS